jgi:serine/threonine protein phosphatase PrpC
VWKFNSGQEPGPLTAEGFAQLFNARGKGTGKNVPRQSADRGAETEEKPAQGTLLVLNYKVTIEGALSIHRQNDFEEKKVKITGDHIPEDFLQKLGLAVTCKKGLKPESPNQDDYSILVDGTTLLLGVFDGHGPFGHCVSNYIHALLPKLISQNEQLRVAPMAVFPLSFEKGQKSLEMHCERAEAKFDCVVSGSTATVVLIQGDRVYSAHVGDSRALIGRLLPSGQREALVLTPDHKPNLDEEKKRIESCGGEVKKQENDIPFRVFLRDRDYPGLAMSRSIGDLLCREIGVISTPTVTEHILSEEDEFVLVCSDGVWEFIENQEAVEFVAGFGRAGAAQAAEQLAKKAWERWLDMEGDVVDDITVMIAYLAKPESNGSL